MLLVLQLNRSAARSWCLGALLRQLWRQLFRHRRPLWGSRGWMRRPRRLWPSFESVLSVQRLGMLASTMRRWMRWACEHSAPAGCPAAADLAAFLQHVSLGGPTAASSVFQVFLWTNQNLGPSGHCSILWYSLSGSMPRGMLLRRRWSRSLGNL